VVLGVCSLWWMGRRLVTIRIDSDGDGEDDATLPLKWVVVILAALASACGLSRFFV
jgi:hypothetical protein